MTWEARGAYRINEIQNNENQLIINGIAEAHMQGGSGYEDMEGHRAW